MGAALDTDYDKKYDEQRKPFGSNGMHSNERHTELTWNKSSNTIDPSTAFPR